MNAVVHPTNIRLARGWSQPPRAPEPVPVPIRRPQPRIAALALLAALACAVPAHAQDWRERDAVSPSDDAVTGRLVSVQVLVGGESAPLYPKADAGRFWSPGVRWYFEAEQGRPYALQLTNRTGRRVGVVLAVDGLNVVNGERSSGSRNEPMYVLGPWETATIRGWRTSLDEVRQFRFVDESRSYAERSGQANGDMGWIRVTTFAEVTPVWQPLLRDGYRSNEAPEAAPRAQADGMRKAAPDAQGLAPEAQNYPGTGWGEAKHDPVAETHFDAQRNATDRLVLRYEYESGLRALGIVPDHGDDRLWEREHGQVGFARPPRW
ncbi:MAG TPA: hypothetical protein VFK69_06625 [Candidatus Eisenbacteria bacterium]|nr:hypothetical protein [Candidatus Eisenbacteria bacterium]